MDGVIVLPGRPARLMSFVQTKVDRHAANDIVQSGLLGSSHDAALDRGGFFVLAEFRERHRHRFSEIGALVRLEKFLDQLH